MRSHRDLAEINLTTATVAQSMRGAGAPARVYKSAGICSANQEQIQMTKQSARESGHPLPAFEGGGARAHNYFATGDSDLK